MPSVLGTLGGEREESDEKKITEGDSSPHSQDTSSSEETEPFIGNELNECTPSELGRNLGFELPYRSPGSSCDKDIVYDVRENEEKIENKHSNALTLPSNFKTSSQFFKNSLRPSTIFAHLTCRRRNHLSGFKKQLIMFFKCFISTFIVITVLQISFPQSVRKITPKPFLPEDSQIRDHFTGNLQDVTEQLLLSELTFVMYYAPWDRESMHAVKPFIAAAEILKNQVPFVAVNCWHPDGSCRSTHQLPEYPAIILHINTGASRARSSISIPLREMRAIAYNGPHKVENYVRFITKAMMPFIHVSDRNKFAELQLSHSAIVLMYIPYLGSEDNDLRETSRDHLSMMYRASLHWIDYDQRSEVVWAVITDPLLAKSLGLISAVGGRVHNRPLVKLVLLDLSFSYHGPQNITAHPQPLLNWVSHKVAGTRTPSWLEVNGGKSVLLNKVFKRGPALIVFSPDHPYEETNALLGFTRGAWLRYSWCATDRSANFTATRMSAVSNYLSDERHLRYIRASPGGCQDIEAEEEEETLVRSEQGATSSDCNEGYFTCHRFMPFFVKSGASSVGELVWSLVNGACQSLFGYNMPSGEFLPPCHLTNSDSSLNRTVPKVAATKPVTIKTSSTGSVRDSRVNKALRTSRREICRRSEILRALERRSGRLRSSVGKNNKYPELMGIGCDINSNRTLSFSVLDSGSHSDIAERWGIDVGVDGTGAVIVDGAEEVHYALSSPLTTTNLAHFIYNYTFNSLNRKHLSNDHPSDYLEDYHNESSKTESVNDKVTNILLEKSGRNKRNYKTKEELNTAFRTKKEDTISLEDLTSVQFMNIMKDSNKNLVVLFHSRSCVHCNTASTALLTAASYFKASKLLESLKESVIFARVDVTDNILPWNVNFDRLPALVFYPHYDGGESRMFHPQMSLTAGNLLRFVVGQVLRKDRLSVGLEGCDRHCRDSLASSLPARVSLKLDQLREATSRQQELRVKLHNNRSGGKQWLLNSEMSSVEQRISRLRNEQQYLITLRNYIDKSNSGGGAVTLHTLSQYISDNI